MRSKILAFPVLVIAFTTIAFVDRSDAVILAGGTSTTGTDAATAPPGFASVGFRVNIASSAVYLGNSYVLTAAHVGAGDTTFTTTVNNVSTQTTYQAVPGSTVPIFTTVGSNTYTADLIVFKINGSPNTPAATIAASTPASGSSVDMVGFGVDRSSDTPSTIFGTHQGYSWTSTHTKRYGTNTTQHFFDYNNGNQDDGYLINAEEGPSNNPTYVTTVFTTDFTQSNPSDAQATGGDSGGGVFTSGTSQLVGTMILIAPFTGQPDSTTVFDEATFSVNLATYRSQILAATPEPGSASLLAVASMGLLKRRARAAR